MDDFTRYAWVYFSYLKDAATVTPLIQAFIALILTQFGIVIQRWRTDRGTGEFLITSVYRTYGMIHQPSTPHVKQQNGAIERRIQTIKNMELMLTSETSNASRLCYCTPHLSELPGESGGEGSR